MTGLPGGAFFEQFIEDYFAECEEHLAVARRALLDLERVGDVPPPTGVVQELFRSLHTLKGLSGMVGAASAERVAHAMEESLRPVRQSGGGVPAALTDALFTCVDLLARCIATRRTAAAPPAELDVALGALADAARGASGESPAAAAQPPPLSPSATPIPVVPDATVWCFEFVPTRELSERGIGVEAIRARLASIGTILDARPRVAAGGVAFDFTVSAVPGQEPDPTWRDDGVRWVIADTAGEVPALPAAADPLPHAAARHTAASAPIPAAVGSGVVRVELARLDEVMRIVGDLVITRSRLEELLTQLGGERADPAGRATRDALEETATTMERELRRLREGVMRIRLVPVGEVFERLRFALRDTARESGKQVALVVHGQDTEIDKQVVDRMLEPLLHLVRNAVSHGIESLTERLARGKPAEGTITLRAATAGDRIIVDVEDDGAGIDVQAVEARARARGMLDADEPFDADALLTVLCAPGFSTRDAADLTSGRGVGMDVVLATVRSLGGSLALETTAGRGTRFVIELPMTLMIVDALLVEVGDQQMAVPQPALREILQVEHSDIVALENTEVITYRGSVLPLLRLARVFRLPDAPRPTAYLLVVGSDAAPTGLLVDRLLGLREIVVHPVPDPLVAVTGISGATELGDGRVSLILDSAAIVRMAHGDARRAPAPVPVGTRTAAGAAPLLQ